MSRFRCLKTGWLAAVLFLSCSGARPKEPFESDLKGSNTVVGAVLVENDGLDDLFESKTSGITVVLVGQWTQDGKRASKGYRIRTDKNGYFRLSAVPAGAFVLKGIELDIGFANRMLITSVWEGESQIFTPGERMIDFNVRVWPPERTDPVNDMGIHYFRIDRTGGIDHNRFQSLNNVRLGLKDKTYTMPNPKTYFENQKPSG